MFTQIPLTSQSNVQLLAISTISAAEALSACLLVQTLGMRIPQLPSARDLLPRRFQKLPELPSLSLLLLQTRRQVTSSISGLAVHLSSRSELQAASQTACAWADWH